MTNQDTSNIEIISEKQLNAIPYIIASRTMVEAAEKVGISRNTLYEWMKNPAFKVELQRQREIVVDEALDRLRNNMTKAVDTLGVLLDNSSNSAIKRLVALDIIRQVMQTREQSEIEQVDKRLSALEKKFLDRTGVPPKVKQD